MYIWRRCGKRLRNERQELAVCRVNGEMMVDRGRLIWELLTRPCLEHGGQEGRHHARIRKKFKKTLAGNW